MEVANDHTNSPGALFVSGHPSLVFPGRMVIDENIQDSNDEALNAVKLKSTIDHVILTYFTDGSFCSQTKFAGYAVVHKRYRPGDPDHGKRVSLAWKMAKRKYNRANPAEGVAALQCYRTALMDVK